MDESDGNDGMGDGMDDSDESAEAAQLIADMLDFLRDGGDDDAAYILEHSDSQVVFNRKESKRWDRYVLDVTLYCPRLAYDMLSDFNHPLRRAISYAVHALKPADIGAYRTRVEVKRGATPPDVRTHLSDLVKRWEFVDDEEPAEVEDIEGVIPAAPAAAADVPVVMGGTGTPNMTLTPLDETLCFVIISFSGDPQLRDFYEKAVRPAVTAMGYRCERVDEQEFNTSIRARIFDNIQRARFIVADMSEARPNCYYELGVAHALGKEVIHIARDMKDVHFDVHDFNFIVYTRIDELRRRLRERIQKTVGPGPDARHERH